MIANHIHDALAQVQRLQGLLLDKSIFHGYSGGARIVSGTAALFASVVLSSSLVPRNYTAQFIGWGIVLLVALVFNYGSLARWFLFDPQCKRDLHRLAPAIDAVPPLAAGAILSLAVIFRGHYDYLFGIWMCTYGLAHVSYRNSLPKINYAVGLFYISGGALCLIVQSPVFLNPWPMGIVFFVGELVGGISFYVEHRKWQALQAEEQAAG